MEEERLHLETPGLQALDVGISAEGKEGRIPGGRHGELARAPRPETAEPLGLGRLLPVAVVCGSGYCSSVACKLLEHQG